MAEDRIGKTNKKIGIDDRLLLILKILILCNGLLFIITNLLNTEFGFLYSWASFLILIGHILWVVFVLQVFTYLIFRAKRKTWFIRMVVWVYGIVIGIYTYNTFTTNTYIPKLISAFVNSCAFVICICTILLLIAFVGYSIYKKFKKQL